MRYAEKAKNIIAFVFLKDKMYYISISIVSKCPHFHLWQNKKINRWALILRVLIQWLREMNTSFNSFWSCLACAITYDVGREIENIIAFVFLKDKMYDVSLSIVSKCPRIHLWQNKRRNKWASILRVLIQWLEEMNASFNSFWSYT
jgi:predicted dithiol-disulfide oxidoreductase (DUF899 family)